MTRLLRFEYVAASIIVAMTFIATGFDWYWLAILFILFDTSAIGYFINAKVGAIAYNTVHSLILPLILLGVYIILGDSWLLFVALLWIFHICVDRSCGFGLKHQTGFHHTHLGNIGTRPQQK